jgi:ATP-binding cassette subfamily A (ABC1) protein 3
VIEAIASKCSVVLTTHHLEEVEALANRVAIMVNGELRCIGNLQHLKHKFGSGFEMSIRVAHDHHIAPFREFISSNFPTARETEFRNHKFTFALDPRTWLSDTFAKIESVKSQLGVTDYSVSQTSLEQVFLADRGGCHRGGVSREHYHSFSGAEEE